MEAKAGKMMVMPAAKGTCCMCATSHDEHHAHNFQSLFYGVRFKLKYGRDPTHGDTIAHLPAELQAVWRKMATEVLGRHGIEWTEPVDGNRIAEPYAESE